MNQNSILTAMQTGWLSVESFGLLRRYTRHGKPPSPEKADPNRRFNFSKPDPIMYEQLIVVFHRLITISAQLVPELPPPIPDDLTDLLLKANHDLKPIWARFEDWSNLVWNTLQARDPVAGQAFTCGGDLADTFWFAQGAGADKLAELLRSYRLRYIAERLNDLSSQMPEQASQAIQHSLEYWGIGERIKDLNANRKERKLERLESQAKVWRDLLFGLRQPGSYLTTRDRRQIAWVAIGATTLLVVLVGIVVWLAVLWLSSAGRALLASNSDLSVQAAQSSRELVAQALNLQNWSALLATLSSVVVLLTGFITRLSGWMIVLHQRTKDWLENQRIYTRTIRSWRV